MSDNTWTVYDSGIVQDRGAATHGDDEYAEMVRQTVRRVPTYWQVQLDQPDLFFAVGRGTNQRWIIVAHLNLVR